MPPVTIDIDMVDRLHKFTPATITHQPGAQGILRRLLELRIERSPHPQPAGIDAVWPALGRLTILADQQPPHFLDEIAISGIPVVPAPRNDPQWLGFRAFRFGDGGFAVLDHLIEHPVAAFDRIGGVV